MIDPDPNEPNVAFELPATGEMAYTYDVAPVAPSQFTVNPVVVMPDTPVMYGGRGPAFDELARQLDP